MPSELNEWEGSLTPEQSLCRDTTFKHNWIAETVRRTEAGFERPLECDRCGAAKTQLLDRDGYVRGYRDEKYPDGYLRPAGSGRVTRADNARMRLASISPRRRR